jgi:hypothetical protein
MKKNSIAPICPPTERRDFKVRKCLKMTDLKIKNKVLANIYIDNGRVI